MKRIIIVAFSAASFSCSKNESSSVAKENSERAPQITYDTTAVDSFGPGATSESVMAKINAVAIKREKDSLAAIAKLQEEKLEKEKAEKEEKIVDVGTRVATYKSVKENMVTKKD